MISLSGLRILELGGGVSAPWATKWLADLGADVIKIEPPGGDPVRKRGPFPKSSNKESLEEAGFFHYLNTNKRSLVLDLDLPADRIELTSILKTVDAVVHNLSAPRIAELKLRWADLKPLHPQLVLCAMTPFGLTGPRSHWRAEEINTAHAGGWAYLVPGASKKPSQPPLKAAGHQADFQTGTTGAFSTLAALFRAQRTGSGEHIDISGQAVVASMLEAAVPYYTYREEVVDRFGQRGLNPWGIYTCRDGLIFLMIAEEDQWGRLIELMGNPDWAQLEIFKKTNDRFLNADALDIFLEEWIAGWKVHELFHEGQKRRICFAPVTEMSELSDNEHLKARGFLAPQKIGDAEIIVPGPPYRLPAGGWGLRTKAPRLDEHGPEIRAEYEPLRRSEDPQDSTPKEAQRPLAGVRVLDLSWVWAGPYCTLQLAHLGAEVIKVESETRPDLGRRLPIYAADTPHDLNSSGYFNQWGQGKKSLALNLADDKGISILKELMADCDVVTENFASGVMDRLGLGWEELSRINPRLIMASISGYGQTGPWSHYSAYGPATPPISGLSALTGFADGPPEEVGLALGDPASGLTAAVGICAALISREKTGLGQHIDISLWEATSILTAEGWLHQQLRGEPRPRMGNRDPIMSPHGCYATSDENGWISIACANDFEWQSLCQIFAPELANDSRFMTALQRKDNEDELDRILGDWVAGHERWDLTERLQKAGIAAFPSATTEDLAHDPQLKERAYFEKIPHPTVGSRLHAGIPWRLSEGSNGVQNHAPLLGAHTEEVLIERLGASLDQIQKWRESGLLT